MPTTTTPWRGFPVLIAAVMAAACGSDPAAPGTSEFETDAPLTADFEQQVASDELVAEVTVEDAALWTGADADAGPWAEARELFRRARRAWRAGDTERAAELALEGRLVLARALVDRRGDEALEGLEARVEIVIERLDAAEDDFARAGDLRDRLSELLGEARKLREAGDSVGAAERLIFALGIADRLRHRYVTPGETAEAHATRAVERAEGVLGRVTDVVGAEPGARVEHALSHARELVRRANAALDDGAWRRAIVLSRRSIGWSLLALRLHLA